MKFEDLLVKEHPGTCKNPVRMLWIYYKGTDILAGWLSIENFKKWKDYNENNSRSNQSSICIQEGCN